MLYKLQWELTAVTPMDFLDHTLPRLCLQDMTNDDVEELRRRIETILVLAATNYHFAYTPASIMAATAIITAIESLGRYNAEAMRNIRLSMQTVIHTSNVSTRTTTYSYIIQFPIELLLFSFSIT